MKTFTKFALLLIALPGSAPSLAAKTASPQEADNGTQIVEKLQKAWDETKTYEANFKQVIYAKRLGTRDESEGKIYVVKPSRLRWEDTSEHSIQILDGKKLIVIQENKRRGTRTVDIYKDASRAVDSRTLNFLAGRTKFSALYNILLLSDSPKLAELKLNSKEASSETLIAAVDKGNYQLKALTTETSDNRVKLDFSDTKINVSFKDELFEYKAQPKDVVHNQ